MVIRDQGRADPDAMGRLSWRRSSSPPWIGLAMLIVGSLVIDALFRLTGVSARAALVAKQEGRI